MEWKSYSACCHRYAADAEVGFCPECGARFVRCLAFAECRSLVTPTGACPVCVAPGLLIDAGAVVQSKAGDRVSVPLILKNASPVARPIWVKQIVRRDSRGDELLALTWEHIEAGAERRFTVDTAPLEGGTHTLRVILVVASRFRGLEETYAFSAAHLITAAGADGNRTIIQNIDISGTGGLVKADVGADKAAGPQATLQDRVLLPLERAEKYELEHAIRGYKGPEGAERVPRHVEFAFLGFPAADRPDDGSTLLGRGRLVCGRNARTPDPGANATPSDLCLRAYDRSGRLDEPATMAISRHHFDLVVVNDRLSVQVRATGGLQVSGEDFGPGEVVTIEPGDRLVPIPGRPDKLSLQFAFTSSIGAVERVTVSRTPPVSG